MQESASRPATAHLDPVAGTRVSCFLLTAMTVLIAVSAGHESIDSVLRPLYFAILLSFFLAIGKRQPQLRVLAFRLIERGFLVLTLGFSAAALVRGLDLGLGVQLENSILENLERGAVFLLGLSLISFGIILWVPHMIDSQRILRERYRSTQGRLDQSERQRERIEQRLVEADRLHAVGELAASIAHDMRNPLAIVKGAADSLTRAHRDPEELAQHSEVICRNIDRAERTISALLDLGRPKEVALAAIDVTVTTREVAALVRLETKSRQITLECDAARPVTAMADRRLLTQALLNLVLNALQASPDRSHLRIRSRQFELLGETMAAIAVEDRGSGLSQAQREQLFTPFFTTKKQGTGLGLLSARRIMDDMKGSVRLYPRSSGGTRALLILPEHAPVTTTS